MDNHASFVLHARLAIMLLETVLPATLAKVSTVLSVHNATSQSSLTLIPIFALLAPNLVSLVSVPYLLTVRLARQISV